MSIGSMSGIAGSVAGSPLAQTRGADVERARQDAGVQQRRVEGQEKAEAASGIGQTDEDQQTAERDADGRLPWRYAPHPPDEAQAEMAAETVPVHDPSGQSGNLLDLTG